MYQLVTVELAIQRISHAELHSPTLATSADVQTQALDLEELVLVGLGLHNMSLTLRLHPSCEPGLSSEKREGVPLELRQMLAASSRRWPAGRDEEELNLVRPRLALGLEALDVVPGHDELLPDDVLRRRNQWLVQAVLKAEDVPGDVQPLRCPSNARTADGTCPPTC